MSLTHINHLYIFSLQSGSYSDLQGPERRYSSPLHTHPQHGMVARDDSFTYSGSSFSLLGSSPQFHQFHSAHASPAMGMRSAGDQKIPGSEVHLPFWQPLSQVTLTLHLYCCTALFFVVQSGF